MCACTHIPAQAVGVIYAAFIGRGLLTLGSEHWKWGLRDSFRLPVAFWDTAVLPAILPHEANAKSHAGGKTACCKNWWDLEMSYPSLTCVFCRVLQKGKRKNEKRTAGNILVTSHIKERGDKSYYLDLSSLCCTQRQTAGVTYLQN